MLFVEALIGVDLVAVEEMFFILAVILGAVIGVAIAVALGP